MTDTNDQEDKYSGEQAINAIKSYLQPNEKCCALADTVFSFYGDSLSLLFDETKEVAAFRIDCDSRQLQEATVFLPAQIRVMYPQSMHSHKLRAPLTHELLHAHLLMLGFPWLCFPNGEDMTEMEQDKADCESSLFNIVQHEIMFDLYRETGLNRKSFSAIGDPRWREIDIDAVVEKYLGEEHCAQGIASLSLEWCREWSTAKHILDAGAERRADGLLDRLKGTKYGDLVAVAGNIKQWFEEGEEFKTATGFVSAFNRLTEMMKMDAIIPNRWVYLQKEGRHSLPWCRVL